MGSCHDRQISRYQVTYVLAVEGLMNDSEV
jgi:hypothetical protein